MYKLFDRNQMESVLKLEEVMQYNFSFVKKERLRMIEKNKKQEQEKRGNVLEKFWCL